VTAAVLVLSVFCTLGSLAALSYAVLANDLVRVDPHRRGESEAQDSALAALGRQLSDFVDGTVRSGSWTPVTALELEMAGISSSVGTFIVTVAAFAVAAVVFVIAVSSSLVLGLVAGIVVPLVAKVILGRRSAKRRAAFEEQLDATLQLLASALRAGHSLARAIDTTSRDSLSPTAEEFGRILNESRIGRDLVDSMHTTADRMQSDDFHWVAEGVAVQRETGGNLNEVLDRVGETIRERSALKREIHTLSSEGRASAVVLLALPVVVSVVQGLVNRESVAPLYTTTTGHIALGVCVVLYGIGGVWMRVITNVKI
jgi:tight adherence protein B